MAITAPWGTAFDLGDITPEDLLSLSTDEIFSELWEGQVIQTPMTSIPHGFLAQKVGMLLAAHVQSLGLPVLIAQHALFDLTQPGQPRTVLAPDVALMQTTNLPSSMPPTYIPQGGPWLAIEILSPTQTMAQMRLKAHAYLAAGGAEVWIINPIQQMIEVHSATGMAAYTGQQPIQSAILPQFTPLVHDLTTV